MVKERSEQEWDLEDATVRASQYPYTFWKPSQELVEKLERGHFVKLIFALRSPGKEDPDAERMWVEITERKKDDFSGRLDNQPEYIAGLNLGESIEFQAKHIIGASIDDPVPDPTLKWVPKCFVTNRILRDEQRIGYLYREEPDREEDSGWRIMCGDEDDEYMDNVDNMQIVSLGAVLVCDDRILPLLDEPAPVAFIWNEKEGHFVADEMPEAE